MKYAIAFSSVLALVSAHGIITQIQGANGVNMPGLSVIDGTPRDCATPACGAEADTSIIRKNELGTGKASAVGRNSKGPINPATVVASFMGTSNAAGGNQSTGNQNTGNQKRAAKGAANGGTKTPKGTKEMGIAQSAGAGASSGLPTTANDGTISMTFHQVNQDGAGPLTAAIDATSGGTDPNAFKTATVSQNVPGIGIGGLSGVTTTDFPVKVQMPAGMICNGTVAGVSNVCIVRLQNSALAGPFGGSAAFTQSAGAQKRAVEFNLRKRHFARRSLQDA